MSYAQLQKDIPQLLSFSQKEIIEALQNEVTLQEQTVLRMWYGLETDQKSREEISVFYGATPKRIRAIWCSARRKLEEWAARKNSWRSTLL